MTLRDETLAFIGCGMMGEAMVKGLLREGLVDPRQIIASHPRAERCLELENRYGVRVTDNNAEAAADATFVAVAVKPQFLGEVVNDLDGVLNMDVTVLSVVAGATTARLGSDFGVSRVVRVMPNTPAQIGRGMSVWTATDTVDELGQKKVRVILSALGAEEYVIHENELDMATALSGTGPAYVFMFMEALVDAGFENQLLLSHDAVPYFYKTFWQKEKRESDWWHVMKHPFAIIPSKLVPILTAAGIQEKTIGKMLIENPKKALAF